MTSEAEGKPWACRCRYALQNLHLVNRRRKLEGPLETCSTPIKWIKFLSTSCNCTEKRAWSWSSQTKWGAGSRGQGQHDITLHVLHLKSVSTQQAETARTRQACSFPVD